MSPTRKFVAAAAGLLMAAGLAACSSSSKNTATSPTSASQSAGGTSASSGSTGSQAPGAPIKVGLVCGCSGVYGTAELPNAEVYRAWVNSVNASGGINGHPIDLTTKDDGGVPGTSISDVQGLISSHVDAIVVDSIESPAWQNEVAAAKIPVVGFLDSDTTFYTNPDFYPVGETNDSQLYAIVATAKTAGAKDLGVIYCAESPVCATLLPAMKSIGNELGLPVTYNASIAATAPNYTAQCVAAQQKHVTALAVFDVSQPIIRLGTDCNQQGYDPIYVTESSGFGLIQATAPGLKNSLWTEYDVQPYWANTAEVQTMNATVDKYYPGLRKNLNGWTESVAQPWAGGLLLEDGIKAGDLTPSQTPSPAEIIQGLNSLHGDTLGGWSPALTFTAGQTHHVNCWFTAHIVNGTPMFANNGQVSCEKASSG